MSLPPPPIVPTGDFPAFPRLATTTPASTARTLSPTPPSLLASLSPQAAGSSLSPPPPLTPATATTSFPPPKDSGRAPSIAPYLEFYEQANEWIVRCSERMSPPPPPPALTSPPPPHSSRRKRRQQPTALGVIIKAEPVEPSLDAPAPVAEEAPEQELQGLMARYAAMLPERIEGWKRLQALQEDADRLARRVGGGSW